jgi:hypothetical protein
MWVYSQGFPKSHNGDWGGTALKPAYEPIIMARKPLIGTVAANFERYGVGGLNIDGCRVPHGGDNLNGGRVSTKTEGWDRPWKHDADAVQACKARGEAAVAKAEQLGRWPANLIHDGSEEVVAGFPASVKGKVGMTQHGSGTNTKYGKFARSEASFVKDGVADDGSAARFFYCAKASRRDRESGLDSVEIVTVQCSSWENEDQKARLRVDTAQSPPRVIGVSGAPCNDAHAWSMLLFGSPSTDPYLLVNKSTIETATNSITESKTLNWLARSNTSGFTVVASCETGFGGSLAANATRGTPSMTITSGWTVSARGAERVQSPTRLTISGNAGSPADHPTVKPTDLMAYLCRLVTPEGGVVLDPFCGSGSTGKAAVREGFDFIGIELDPEYAEIARKRIEAEAKKSQLYQEATI